MFDQNWLKRYMLSNNPTKLADPGQSDVLGEPTIGDGSQGVPRVPLPASKVPSESGRAWAPAGGYLAEQPRQAISSDGVQHMPASARMGAPMASGRSAAGLPGYGAAGLQAVYSGPGGCSAREDRGTAPGIPQASLGRPDAVSAPFGGMPGVGGAQQAPGGAMTGLPPGMGAGTGASGGFFGPSQNPFGSPMPFDGGNSNMFNMWGGAGGGGGGFGARDAGPRHYVVICKDDVEVRASPTYSDDTRIGHFLHPGQIVLIDERRMVTGSNFLHLADGRGWVFETKERLLVMTEAKEYEFGLWHYSVVCDDDVETRLSPTYSDDMRTGSILASGDCIAVDERCVVAGARFLKLADGRGWVFETKDRLCVMSEVRAKAQEARDFARGLWHYTVVCDDDVEIRAAPTYSDEARTGLMVHPGDCVAVDERCRVAAVWFLRLADGRGWVFETKDSRRVMMQLH